MALIFKLHFVADVLKINQGFDDERIDFGIRTGIGFLSFNIMAMGGFLLLGNLSAPLNELAFAFQSTRVRPDNSDLSGYAWVVPALTMVIGYLLLKNHQNIALWMTR